MVKAVAKRSIATTRSRRPDRIHHQGRIAKSWCAACPNDEYSDMHSFIGYEHDEGSWARAIREALRAPYVVQERVKPARTVFPLMNYGHLE